MMAFSKEGRLLSSMMIPVWFKYSFDKRRIKA